ncbi:MAG: hypothetical protein AB1349_04075 [Elusimicrobiota bacterium]
MKTEIKNSEIKRLRDLEIREKTNPNSLISIFLISILFSLFSASFIGCGKKSTQLTQTSQQITPRPKPKIPQYVPPPPLPKYTYTGGKYRDPLIPAGGSYSSSIIAGEGGTVLSDEQLATLQLKGIFRDPKIGGIALIADTSGGSYILKNGKLYDRKNKIIPKVAGVIGKNMVTLFSDNTKLELKLRKGGEEKKK